MEQNLNILTLQGEEMSTIDYWRDRLRALIFWGIFWGATVTLFHFNILIYLWNFIFNRSKRSHGAHWLAGLWGRTIMHAAPGWRWSFSGLDNLPKKDAPPVVFVANHQSAADIGAIYLTRCQFRWLSKDSIFKMPIIGLCMRWAGYVPIKRGDRDSHAQALMESSRWIRRGVSMFFFPEGTRSEDGKLKEFKQGAFRLAIEEGVAVCPIVLSGTRDMMLKNSGIPRPAHLIFDVLPLVYHQNGESAEEFAKHVQILITNRLSYLETIR